MNNETISRIKTIGLLAIPTALAFCGPISLPYRLCIYAVGYGLLIYCCTETKEKIW